MTFYTILFAPYLVWSYDTFYILFRCCVVCTTPFGGSSRGFGCTRQSRFGILFISIRLCLWFWIPSLAQFPKDATSGGGVCVCFISARGCDRSSQKYVHTYTYVLMSFVYAFVDSTCVHILNMCDIRFIQQNKRKH